ncbi:prolyl oligopeptidase [Silvimonas terrae]|uniref:prolyl oligopeptidase n=1 Tax=Silvimonas terrae TaxID=300266 RepID=A0A840RJD1_9NEIS|nr:prolyl oligopeptidase family serine peptidase [Silvimonas terrae]MBB5192590.1 prolyl oligopeptidase [Silvimonas terrae]
MASQGWQRRDVLKILGAMPLLTSLPSWAAIARPPAAPLKPVTETLWDIKVTDPYRWMENTDSPQWQQWLKGQAQYARQVLDAIPGRAALAKRLSELSAGAESPNAIIPAPGRVFYSKRPKNGDNFKLFMRNDGDATEHLLLDPTAIQIEGSHVALDWWLPSPDGKYVVYGMSKAGSENSVLRVLNVDTNTNLPEEIDRTPQAGPTWLPDSSGFFYNRYAPGRKPTDLNYQQNSVNWLHKLGTPVSDDQRMLAANQWPGVVVDPLEFPFIQTDPSSDYVLAVSMGGVRLANPWYSAKLADVLAGKPDWRKVCDITDDVNNVIQRGDQLYLLSTHGAAQNGQILRTSAAMPDLQSAQVVRPAGDVVISAMTLARDGLYLQLMDGGYNTLSRIDDAGKNLDVKLPYEGSIDGLGTLSTIDGIWFTGSSWLVPFTIFRFDPATGQATDTGLCAQPDVDLSLYEAHRTFAIARDGTRVPLSIVAKKGLKRDGKNPTLVQAYGSYQIVSSPYFSTRFISFLEQGGVMATAHVRGGGEYGKRWWQAGKGPNKHNTWGDLIDCCKSLIKDGWTDNHHLAIEGGSAGGITVGRAMTEAPELFAVVVSDVGASNTVRMEFSPNGPDNIDEFGSIKNKQGFKDLLAMDSTQHVKNGTRYPAVLLTTGVNDPRVAPWEVGKMTARLQKATTSGKPVILSVDYDAGHGMGSSRKQIDEHLADEYAFIFWQTGVKAFQPR